MSNTWEITGNIYFGRTYSYTHSAQAFCTLRPLDTQKSIPGHIHWHPIIHGLRMSRRDQAIWHFHKMHMTNKHTRWWNQVNPKGPVNRKVVVQKFDIGPCSRRWCMPSGMRVHGAHGAMGPCESVDWCFAEKLHFSHVSEYAQSKCSHTVGKLVQRCLAQDDAMNSKWL